VAGGRIELPTYGVMKTPITNTVNYLHAAVGR